MGGFKTQWEPFAKALTKSIGVSIGKALNEKDRDADTDAAAAADDDDDYDDDVERFPLHAEQVFLLETCRKPGTLTNKKLRYPQS